MAIWKELWANHLSFEHLGTCDKQKSIQLKIQRINEITLSDMSFFETNTKEQKQNQQQTYKNNKSQVNFSLSFFKVWRPAEISPPLSLSLSLSNTAVVWCLIRISLVSFFASGRPFQFIVLFCQVCTCEFIFGVSVRDCLDQAVLRSL